MIYEIKNDDFVAKISELGAEIQSVVYIKAKSASGRTITASGRNTAPFSSPCAETARS